MIARPTYSDCRDLLSWAVAHGVSLAPTPDGGLTVEGSTPVPDAHRGVLLAGGAVMLAPLLAAMAAPAPLATVALWLHLEQRLHGDTAPDDLLDLLHERAGIRQHDGRLDLDSAELLALGDVARLLAHEEHVDHSPNDALLGADCRCQVGSEITVAAA